MADNFTTEQVGVPGKTFASDEVVGGPTGGTCDYSISKLAFGPLNSATIVEDASGARFPVKIGDGLSASALVSGQVTLSGSEAALPTVVARRFRLKAHTDNGGIIYLGTTGVTTGTGFPLWPGDIVDVEVGNLNVIHAIVSTGTQMLCYLGMV